MTDFRTAALRFAHDNRQTFIDELKIFASIPSISTDPEHRADIQRAAEWVAEKIRSVGMHKVQVMPTAGHPVVYGELLATNPNLPMVLFYGHYDVQPPDPVEFWESPPFEPTQRGDNIYARGVSDMKGQVLAALNATRAVLSVGPQPVNIKFLLEGEEEIGSPSLKKFISDQRELLACDYVVNPDTGMLAPDIPTITYALRGLAYFELRIYGPDHDLHSGTFGGTVNNPAQVLCELIAGLHDDDGRVTLPGFYDTVLPLSDEERTELARLPMDSSFYQAQTGVQALWGEKGYTPVERAGARPTLEANGILAGYTGIGGKTVIPAQAMAKISTRLVPNQVPDEVHRQFREYLVKHVPPTVRWELDYIHNGLPCISDRHSPAIQSLSKAMEVVWGKKPVFKREGGSVPVVAMFKELIGVDSVNTGFSLYDDKTHSPNEKIHLPTWFRGIDTLIHFMYNLGGKGEI